MKFLKYTVTVLLIITLIFSAIWGTYQLFPLKYTILIRQEAELQGVDRYLIAALMKAESNFDERAVSAANAKGLMQLTDETAQFCADQMGIVLAEGDIYNPEINVKLGVCYLSRMLSLFNDEDLAVAAYNAGEGRVKQWLSDPSYSTDGTALDTIPYRETERHVMKITAYQKIYKFLYPNL